MSTFVLVHGAWHGGWCYKRTAAILRREGHEVYAPTLTGVGERSHLATQEINLSLHILDVSNVLKWEELDDIVLWGHSYGGMVITGSGGSRRGAGAGSLRISRPAPEENESLGSAPAGRAPARPPARGAGSAPAAG